MMIFLFCLASAVAPAAPLRVMLDPGHGGRDHGAVSAAGDEAAVTLDVVRRLGELLKTDRRFRVEQTRTENALVALPARARRAHAWNADLFLSVHVNSSPDPRAHGAEFYFRSLRAADEESAFLAHRENDAGPIGTDEPPRPAALDGLSGEIGAIVGDLLDTERVLRSSRLSKWLKTSWSGPRKGELDSVRQAPFFVLNQVNAPSALVELGFLTNAADARRLTSSGGRQAMARDLYRGLQRYVESFTTGNATRQP